MNEGVGSFKIFEVSPEYQRYKQEARDLLFSVEGIEMRVNRSIQAEGAFGGIKQNMSYTRLRRTSIDKASLEIMLTCLGFNLRKYMKAITKGTDSKNGRLPIPLFLRR